MGDDSEGRTAAATVRRYQTGPATWALGSLFERLLSGTESAGAMDVSLVTQPPGNATPLHLHAREAEAFYLLDGSMTYRAGEETYHLSGGDFLYLPAGVPHALRITGDQPIRFLAITAPAGLMDLYDEIGTPADQPRLPDLDPDRLASEIAAWSRLSGRFGVQILGPPLPPDA